MKVLYITYSYLGGHGGGVYASRTHINLFVELSEAMTLVYPYKEVEELNGIYKEKLDLLPVQDNRNNIKKFLDLLFGKVHRYSFDQSFFNREKFDVVVFDNSVVSSGLIRKFKKAGMKTITIHHNYQIQYLLGDGSRRTLLFDLFWTWIYERQAVRYSNLNITLTKQDVELLQNHYGKNYPFSVLGVFEYHRETPVIIPKRKKDHHYVITGGLGSKQTEDSILRWLKNYYPLLKQTDPKAKITIAGSNPSVSLKEAILSRGITLIESPKSMAPILSDADYYLCPVDCGGGLKLRNLDGLKYGLPVLSHKVSLRGYEKMEKYGVVFSYESKPEFIEGINNMQGIQFNRDSIQQLYLQQYQFDNGIKRLSEILTQNHFL